MKPEYKIISDLIEKNAKVLDVGCDDGTLMEFLKTNKNVNIRGIEISKKARSQDLLRMASARKC